MSKADSSGLTYEIPTLKRKRALAGARYKATLCGVYALLKGEEILYVGQSSNLYARLVSHMRHAPFVFEEFIFTECAPHELSATEARMIRELNPRWNKNRGHKASSPEPLSLSS